MDQEQAALEQSHREQLDGLFTETFNSILRIEERSLNNRITQGLSITEIHTIVAVGLYESNPMSVVAARLDVTLGTLVTAVNKLEKAGFVKRERCEEDRRKVLLSLTNQGRKVYRVHAMFHQHMVDEALSDLSEEEERVLMVALGKVKSYFDQC